MKMYYSRISTIIVLLACISLMRYAAPFPPHPLMVRRTALDLPGHARYLSTKATETADLAQEVYQNYIQDARFDVSPIGEPSETTVQSLNVPDVHDVPCSSKIRSMTDQDIIEVHYKNIIKFIQLLEIVNRTETEDVSVKINDIVWKLKELINRLEVMADLGDHVVTLAAPEATTFQPNPHATSTERNNITQYVLHRFSEYMRTVAQDYRTLDRILNATST